MTQHRQKVEIEIPVYDGFEYVRYGFTEYGDYRLALEKDTWKLICVEVPHPGFKHAIYRKLPEFPGYKYLGYRLPEKEQWIYNSKTACIIQTSNVQVYILSHVYEKIAPKETILKWLHVPNRGQYSGDFPFDAVKIIICGEDLQNKALFWRTSPSGLFRDCSDNLISHLAESDRQYFAVLEEGN